MKRFSVMIRGVVVATALLAASGQVEAASFTGLGDLAGGSFLSRAYEVSGDELYVGFYTQTPEEKGGEKI